MTNFVSMLLKVLQLADFSYKVQVLAALQLLQADQGIPNGSVVQQAVLRILADDQNPPSCVNEHQKRFIMAGLTMMQTLGIYGREFYTELMVQFLEADSDVRWAVHIVLSSLAICSSNYSCIMVCLLQESNNGHSSGLWAEGRTHVLSQGAGQLGHLGSG